MPFLDDLILGKPGGDRRQRYANDSSLTSTGDVYVGGAPDDSFLPSGRRRRKPNREVSGANSADRERRACGNLTCGNGWRSFWKQRDHPIFEGQWACSSACLAAMVRRALARETGDGLPGDEFEQHHHRIPLGLVILAQGWITHPQLQKALEAQREHGGGRIGEWLVSECGMQPERVARGLSLQWNCPVLSTEGFWPEAMALALPRVFLEEYGVVPVRLAGRKILYIGFRDYLDASTSFALEQMTGLRTESGILPEAEFSKARETLLRCEFPAQTIAAVGDRDGLARAIAETVEHLQPESSRLVKLHRFHWLRIWANAEGGRTAGDLPSNTDRVTDYLFTIGSDAAHSSRAEQVDQTFVASRGYGNVKKEAEEEAEASDLSSDVNEISPSEVLPAAQAVNHVDVDSWEDSTAEPDPGAPQADAAFLLKEAAARLSLARLQPWSDEVPAKAGFSARPKILMPVDNQDLRRFMRSTSDEKVEPLDGEYLAERYLNLAPTALAPETQTSGWNRIGLLQRLKPSFRSRETDPVLDPGQEG